MLLFSCQIAAFTLLAAALIQGVCAISFTRKLFLAAGAGKKFPRHDSSAEQVGDSAEVGVVLSLRGADPDLVAGLKQLFSQSHPNYHVTITLDRADDPAAAAVQEAIAACNFSRVSVQTLVERRETCSLKNSALLQMLASMPRERRIVVQADGDLQFHEDWLKELVAPFADKSVGAVFGNRWFWPEEGRMGSLVRYLWNAAAVIPMWMFRIPWGGTLAIRREVFEQTDLVSKLSRAAVDDALMRSAVEQLGKQIVFAPLLMMTNREECSSNFALEFITRQMLWTRLYHPRWLPVVLHAAGSTALLLACLVLLLWGAVTGNGKALLWLCAGVGSYQLLMVLLVGILEQGMRQIARVRQEVAYQPRWGHWLKVMLAIPVTQIIYAAAVLRCCLLRKISWRGIEYQILSPFQVGRLNDSAFVAPLNLRGNESL